MQKIDYQLEHLPGIANKLLGACSEKIICFQGDLGAGKTTLIKALCKALGSNDDVTSPSFSIVNEYESTSGQIFHFDFYRIETIDEVYDLGFEDYLNQDAWLFIEWPERIAPLIDFKHHNIKIEFNALLQRELNFY